MKSSKRKSTRSDKHDLFQQKISETLIHFAKPILDHIDEHTTVKDISTGLMVAITVWNAMVMDRWWIGEDNLNKVRSLMLEKNDPQGTHLIEVLAERKKNTFSTTSDQLQTILSLIKTATSMFVQKHAWIDPFLRRSAAESPYLFPANRNPKPPSYNQLIWNY
jgi:hypothetical protein